MPIRTEDVKIKESQRLTDNTDGGGYMTAREVVDGAINNMFTDISRLDRAYGRVSLRKGYVHVDTDDTEMYSGAHMIISELAKDPNVNVAIFKTENDADTRIDAVNRLESWVTLGPRSEFWLWGDQPAGSRNLLMFGIVGATPPEVGDVLCLFNNKDTAAEYRQYVRVMKCGVEVRGFGGFSRLVLNIEIGDPLEVTFNGMEVHGSDSYATSVYTTNVSDAAKYYGVMRPRDAIRAGDIDISVESIYARLVPTAQAESPLLNLRPGESGPIARCGENCAVSFPSDTWTTLNLGQALVPGTLELRIGNTDLTDTRGGVLMNGGNQAGTVNYSTGLVTLAPALSGAVTASFDPGVAMANIPTTLRLDVFAASRGYNYVAIMWPPPLPGSITVDYMAEAQWYRLRDNGAGALVPDIEGTGTGRIDYDSGQMAITCAALPDVETPILISWGNPVEIVRLAGEVDIHVEPVAHKLSGVPVAPGSLSISWPVGVSETEIATDDGSGWIVEGDEIVGWVNYGTGELEFTPARVPVAGSAYTFNHERYAEKTHVATGTNFTLPDAPIEPGSLSMTTTVSREGWNQTLDFNNVGLETLARELGMDASGASSSEFGLLFAPEWEATLTRVREAKSSSKQYSESSGEQTGGGSTTTTSGSGSESGYSEESEEQTTLITFGPMFAEVNWVTGRVIIDLRDTAGKRTIVKSQAVKSESSGSSSSTTTKTYRVVFVDGRGRTLSEQDVEEGTAATAPPNPTRSDCTFKGWDKPFDDIDEAMTVTALWTCRVTFVDGQGNILKEEDVEEGGSATPPANVPRRNGWQFTGWDKPFANVFAHMTVTALWEERTATICRVVFMDGQGNTLKTQDVEEGGAATAPKNPTRRGYTFTGWDREFDNVTDDVIVTALWEAAAGGTKKYTVYFLDRTNILKEEEVEEGGSATPPPAPTRKNYTFKGWDRSFSNITAHTVVNAKWKRKNDTPSPTEPPEIDVPKVEWGSSSNPEFTEEINRKKFDWSELRKRIYGVGGGKRIGGFRVRHH